MSLRDRMSLISLGSVVEDNAVPIRVESLLLRHFGGRKGQPTAVCIDSRTLQSTPESGARAGYDDAKRRKGSRVHIAVDTLGHLMALKVTAASEGDREQVAALAEEVQQGHRRLG